jgi:hypothetical protein
MHLLGDGLARVKTGGPGTTDCQRQSGLAVAWLLLRRRAVIAGDRLDEHGSGSGSDHMTWEIDEDSDTSGGSCATAGIGVLAGDNRSGGCNSGWWSLSSEVARPGGLQCFCEDYYGALVPTQIEKRGSEPNLQRRKVATVELTGEDGVEVMLQTVPGERAPARWLGMTGDEKGTQRSSGSIEKIAGTLMRRWHCGKTRWRCRQLWLDNGGEATVSQARPQCEAAAPVDDGKLLLRCSMRER